MRTLAQLCAIIYVLFLHYMPGINVGFDRYVYSVLLCFALQLVMEALLWIFAELTRSVMLAVSCGMLGLGQLFILAGMFVRYSASCGIR